MWNKHCKIFVLILAALAFFSAAAWARNRHEDLNGAWKLVPTRSELNGERAVEGGTVTIHDHGSKIDVQQNFTYGGQRQTATAGFTIAGRKNIVINPGSNFWSIADWQNGVLQVQTTDNGLTSVERFSLQPDGTMMLLFEQPGHKPVTLFFERQ